MESIRKIYHRGNDDKKEGNYLTAIFKITLNAINEPCCVIAGERGPMCPGFVIFYFEIVIKSPEGKGNGNETAAGWAPNYGVETYGIFSRFNNTKPKGADKDAWQISSTVLLIPIPCSGGASRGKIVFQISDDRKAKRMAGRDFDKYTGEAYAIEYSMSVAWCGKVTMDFTLKQGKKAFALDGGDPDLEVRKRALKEVKKGDKPPFGLKTAHPPTADMVVTESGEIEKTTPPK